jgi:hypothetical protein
MTDTFDIFWDSYPRKVGKTEGAKAYAKAVKKHGAQTILDGLHKWNKTREPGEQRFIPHASTWLNKCRFLDDFDAIAKGQPSGDTNFGGKPRKWINNRPYSFMDALEIEQRKRGRWGIEPHEEDVLKAWNRK